MENLTEAEVAAFSIRDFLFFCIGFVAGGFSVYFLTTWLRKLAYRNKLFGIDGSESIKTLIVFVISLIWMIAALMGIFTRTPIDPSIHILMGGIVGAYFGINIFQQRKNEN